MSRPTLDTVSLQSLSYTRLSLSLAGTFHSLSTSNFHRLYSPNPKEQAPWFGLFRVRSPLLTESHFVFSSSGYLDVSVHRVPSLNLWIQFKVTEVFSAGLPHSDICGSKIICISPQLFAAYHVFHRLLVPRHPPCALHSLNILRNANLI